MKTIGLIGGMSWESSAQYYALINRGVRDRLGSPNSAQIVMDSLNFAPLVELGNSGKWDELGDILAASAMRLDRAGADCIGICTNTMHKLVDRIEAVCDLPVIHIADVTAERIAAEKKCRVALLGTIFTMEQDFYQARLSDLHGLEVIVPDEDDRQTISRIIYDELVAGKISADSRQAYRDIIASLVDDGAEGVILGCTEIMLLIDQSDSRVPLYDTTAIHAEALVNFALS